MRSAGYVIGLSAALLLSATALSSRAATVTCPDTLYDCVYDATDTVVVITTLPGSLSPLEGYGAYLHNKQALIYDLTVHTSGSSADAIRLNSVASMLIADRLTIAATGQSADGIYLNAETNADFDALVYVKNYANIESVGGTGVRATNFDNANANSVIILPDGTVVRQTGAITASNSSDTVGYGVYAGNRDRDTDGIGFLGILQGENNNTLGNSYVFLGRGSTISTAANTGHAVYANKGGLIQLGDNVSVTTTGQNAIALYASLEQQGSHTSNIRPGHIYLGGGATLRASGSPYVIQASGLGSVIANKTMVVPTIADGHQRSDRVTGLDKSITQTTFGVFDIIGKIAAKDGGEVSLNMTSGSQFLGATTIYPADAISSNITLDISGANSVWKLDEDSSLSSLTLSDGARLTPYSSLGSLTNFTLQGDGFCCKL